MNNSSSASSCSNPFARHAINWRLAMWDAAVTLVSAYYRIPRAKLFRTRRKEICTARAMLWTLGRDICGLTLSHIGDLSGGKDHTSICYGIRRTHDTMDVYPAEKQDYDYLRAQLLAQFQSAPAPQPINHQPSTINHLP